MTPEQLAEIEALVAALPDSPWFLADCEGDLQLWLEGYVEDIARDADGNVTGYRLPGNYPIEALVAEWDLDTWDEGQDEQEDQFRAYARFMAAARIAVPALLADLKRLQAKVDAVTKVADQLDQDATDGSWSSRDPDIARLSALRDTQREIATTLRRAIAEAGEGR